MERSRRKGILLGLFLLVVQTVQSNFLSAQTNAISFFTARLHQDGIQLSWEMTAGSTCSGIIIYHGDDSVQLDVKSSIDGVCGDPGFAVEYTYLDTLPFQNSDNYYRIELGGLGFSDIVSVYYRLPINAAYLVNYSAYQTELIFRYENYHRAHFFLFDLTGKLVYETFFSGSAVQIPAILTHTGFGFFRVQQEGAPMVEGKLILTGW